VGEYLLNNRWVFDTGDDPDITTAFATNLNVDIKAQREDLLHIAIPIGSPRVMGTYMDTWPGGVNLGGAIERAKLSYWPLRVRRRLAASTRLRSNPPISSRNPPPIAAKMGLRYTIVK